MDPLTITAALVALAAFSALVFVSGYEHGHGHGVETERRLADRRVRGLLDDLNSRRVRPQQRRRP